MCIKGFIVSMITLSSCSLMAQQVSILPVASSNLSDTVFSGKGSVSVSKGLEINLYASCYARNLRGVSNPIGRNSKVTMALKFPQSPQDTYKTLHVEFPSPIVVQDSSQVLSGVRVLDADKRLIPTAKASGVGNVLRLNVPDMIVGKTELDEYGNIKTSFKEDLLSGYSFTQEVSGVSGPYRAKSGPLSADVRHKVDNGAGKIEIYANFPGENGFCGGFYSPLAFFFEKGFMETKFDGVSTFPLNDEASAYYWPSKKDEVYFLSLDLNKDGKINNGTELFGESGKFKNGFDELAQYDKNSDQLIDYRDEVFRSLKLWRDKNSNGISEANELESLKNRNISFISLKYKNDEEFTYGDRAKARERSYFVYKNKKGRLVKSDVFDIWLAPKQLYPAQAESSF